MAATAMPAPVVVTHVLTDAAGGGRRRNTRGDRPRGSFVRDRLSVVLVAGGILVVLVAVLDPHLSILSGGVLPATATAPAIARVSPTPTLSLTPTPTLAPTPSPTASPSPSDPPSPSLAASPDPTPVITPRPTPRPTPIPTPFPTPVPTSTPRPTPRPTPKPPVYVVKFTCSPSCTGTAPFTVTFQFQYMNASTWVLDLGDGSQPISGTGSGSGLGSGSYTIHTPLHKPYPLGHWSPTLTLNGIFSTLQRLIVSAQ